MRLITVICLALLLLAPAPAMAGPATMIGGAALDLSPEIEPAAPPRSGSVASDNMNAAILELDTDETSGIRVTAAEKSPMRGDSLQTHQSRPSFWIRV